MGWVALFALSMLAASLADGRPAFADTAVGTLVPTPGKNFTLTRDNTAFDSYGAAVRAIEGSTAVTLATPLDVTQGGGSKGRALCHPTDINDTYHYNGFCWSEADDTTSAVSNVHPGGWTPQGLTASHDAGLEPGGTYQGHQLVISSWYYGVGWSDDPATNLSLKDRFGRISIVDATGASWNYGHVMLVKPTGSGATANYVPVEKIHADGVAWYRNYLYVANGGELQVYDLNHLWKMKAFDDRTNIENNISSAMHHGWALPMVGRYYTKVQPDARSCPGEDQACFSSLSVDRNGSSHNLVSGAFLGPDDPRTGHIARWPLNETTGLLDADSAGVVTKTDAYATPVAGIQGVAKGDRWYYISAICPAGFRGTNPATLYTCIYRAEPNGPVTVLTRTPTMTQNLSYSTYSKRLWGLNEKDTLRTVFSLVPTTADASVYLENDYSKLCAGGESGLDNGHRVIQWGCINAQDERWVFELTTDALGNPAYFLRNEYSGKCMGTGSKLDNGTGMIQWTCNGAVDEKWWYDETTRELRNVYSGKCLGLGSGAAKGSQLIQWTCNGAADEKWNQVPR
ncbi:RICIN domain-containing protein [Streptomyces zaomyceticus]|uniref:RICIN domain-containing protein n=1 Tax=Streptomyces zaomyceticus TaxID=68286 RepID=UPI0034274BE1